MISLRDWAEIRHLQDQIERFHQTLELWLAANTPTELQAQLARFRIIYNEQRPHRALDRHTPQQAYDATVKASPAGKPLSAHYRVRHHIIDRFGKLTLRRAGQLHHLGVSRQHARKTVLILTDKTTVTITDHTRELISRGSGSCPPFLDLF